MRKLLQFTLLTLLVTLVSVIAKAEKATLTNAKIVAAGTGQSGYQNWKITDNNNKVWNAYAIKDQHSNATSGYHFLQIKKYASNTAYYIQIPEYGSKITSITMTVSGANNPMNSGGNTATLYFSASNSTSATGNGVASGTGSSSVTIDCSSLDLNTGYITASGAVRIWDVTVTYESGSTSKVAKPTFSPEEGEVKKGTTVNFRCATENVTYYYTTDGSEPNVNSVNSSEGSSYTVNSNVTLKVIAVKDGMNNSDVATAEYTVKKGTGVYAEVLTVEWLQEGDNIIIVNNEAEKVLSTEKPNNRGATGVEIQINNEENSNSAPCYSMIREISEDAQIITLEGDKNGWYFNVGEKGSPAYLYAASSSNNYLRTTNSKENNAKAWIFPQSFDLVNIEFQGSNTHNQLRYNDRDNLFSCYKSGQKQVTLYKECLTISEIKATNNNSKVMLLLDGCTVLNSYVDNANALCHVFIRSGVNKDEAIELVIPTENSEVQNEFPKGKKLSGYLAGKRQTSVEGSSVDRILCEKAQLVQNNQGVFYTNSYFVSPTDDGDITPIELSSTDNIGDYSCNYVKLTEQKVTSVGQVGSLPLNDSFNVVSTYKNPYVGASVDVTGIAYLTNNTEILPIELSGSNNTSNSPYTYVFNEMKTLVQPTEKYEGVPARLVRKFYSDGWNTLRLPFHVETARFNSVFGDDVVAVTFSGLSKDEERNALLMHFEDTGVTKLGNNMNLLVKVSNDIENPAFDEVTIEPEPTTSPDITKSATINGETYYVTFRGILEPTQITGGDDTKLFLGSSGNELVYASTTNNLRATRCYFDLSFNILEAETNTAFFEIGGEAVTTIDGIPVANFTKGHVYSIQGQYMGESTTNLPKGLYIVNGKKVVIK